MFRRTARLIVLSLVTVLGPAAAVCADVVGPQVSGETIDWVVDWGMHSGGWAVHRLLPFDLSRGFWRTIGSVEEDVLVADKLTLSWNARHISGPHEEDPNPNRWISSFVVDGPTEHTDELLHHGDRCDCGIRAHEFHWDVYFASTMFCVDPNGKIMFWSWLLTGDHIYSLPDECFLGGHADDGGVTPDRGGGLAVLADTTHDQLTVHAAISGVPQSSVLTARVRSGPSGPAIITLDPASFAEDGGALLIDARYVNFAHQHVAALVAGQGYLELVTAQGNVGGYFRPIAPSVTGVTPSGPATRLELEISPNPAVRSIHLRYWAPSSGQPISLLVHDVSGRRVRAVTLAASAEGTYTLDLHGDDGAHLAAGLYFATLSAGDRRVTQRFVVVD